MIGLFQKAQGPAKADSSPRHRMIVGQLVIVDPERLVWSHIAFEQLWEPRIGSRDTAEMLKAGYFEMRS